MRERLKLPSFRSWGVLFFCFCVSLGCFFVLGQKIVSLSLAHFTDPNEPWNLFKIQELASGQSLYHPDILSRPDSPERTLLVNNYPPLSFYLVYGLHSFLGVKSLAIGRALAGISLLGCACFVSLFAGCLAGAGEYGSQRRLKLVKRKAALGAFCVFLLLNSLIFRRYVAMYDPQWWAELISLFGVFLFFGKLSYSRIFLVAFLLVLAGFFKHNLLTLPLSLTFWLFFFERKYWLFWCGCGLALAFGGLCLCGALYGKAFFENVIFFEFNRIHSWAYFQQKLLPAGLLFCLLNTELALIFYVYKKSPSEKFQSFVPQLSLWVLVAVIGLGLGLYGATGWGGDVNLFFDSAFGISVLAGWLFSAFSGLSRQKETFSDKSL